MQVRYQSAFQKNQIFNWLIFGLLGVMYLPVVSHWVDGWLNKSIGIEHEYFSHALIGFPFAAYITWNNRHKWRRLPNQSHPLGAVCLLIAAALYLTQLSDLVNLSFPLFLTGICLWLKGMKGLKLQGFPLILVWLGTPNFIPYLLTPYTLPLQKFIATVAGFILSMFGFAIKVQDIYLSVNNQTVEVAPYCAGLKMLFTSLYVSLMLLYWTDNLNSGKKISLLLIGATLISVTANIIRNALLAMFHGIHQEKLFDWLHEGWGGDLYSALMLGMIVLLLKIIDKLAIDDPIETESDRQFEVET